MTVEQLRHALTAFDPGAHIYIGAIYGTWQIQTVDYEHQQGPSAVVLEAGADAPSRILPTTGRIRAA